MVRPPDEAPEPPEASREPSAPGAEEASPAGDSAGVYYLAVEAFEARLPRRGGAGGA